MTKIYSYLKHRAIARIRHSAAALLASVALAASASAARAADTTDHVHQASDNSVLPKCSGCDSYLISTADGLTEFASKVNGGQTAINAVLMNDITINANLLDNLNDDGTPKSGYTPVQTTTIAQKYTISSQGDGQYKGTFDGNGHSITGIYMYNAQAGEKAALFGFIGYNGVVKNLTVKDSYLYALNNACGIANSNWEGTISGCHVSGGVIRGGNAVGICITNMASISSSATIENCTNSANVIGKKIAAGISQISYNNACITGCSNSGTIATDGSYGSAIAAGICVDVLNDSYHSNSYISNCTNTGKIAGNDAAGICKKISGNSISNCTNSGTIEGGQNSASGICTWSDGASINDCTNTGDVTSSLSKYSSSIAGICALASNTKINRCTNSGHIYTYTHNYQSNFGYVSGICGQSKNGTTISFCENKGEVEIKAAQDKSYVFGYYASGICSEQNDKGSISDCTNSGALTGTMVSGICGTNTSGTILRCSNTADLNANLDFAYNETYNRTGQYFRAAGICCESTSASTIRDCYSTGYTRALAYITKGDYNYNNNNGPSVVAGISYCKDGNDVVENCFALGTLVIDGESYDARNQKFPVAPAGTGCYYKKVAGADADQDGIESRDEADFQSGAVAYALNKGTSDDNAVWRQNLTADSYPKLAIDGAEAIVYAARHLKCDGQTMLSSTYSNNAGDAKDVVDNHKFGDLTADTPDSGTENLYSFVCESCHEATSDDAKLIKNLYGEGNNVKLVARENSTVWTSEKAVSITDLGNATSWSAPVPFSVPSVSYRRTMANSWGTLCLPFAFEADAANADLAFYDLDAVSADCVSLTRRTGTIPAATPLIVWSRNAAALDIQATAEPMIATAPADGSEADGLQMAGAFATEDVTSGYILSGNALWNAATTNGGKVRINAFRSYLRTTTAQPTALRLAMSIDGTVTAIDRLNAADGGKAEIYDVQGRRTDRLQHGLNIVRRAGKTIKINVK